MKNLLTYTINAMIIFILSSHIALADTDYNQAKKLLDTGKILPLEKILVEISKHTPGHIIEVELETDDNKPLYEIELIDSKGLVWELKVDAMSGEVIKKKQDD